MRAYFILFFLASFSIAFVVREKKPHFQTAVLKKDCECQSSYFAYDRLEMVSKPLQLKQDRVLGKLCQKNDEQVECRVERKDAPKEGGVICPMSCVSLAPTRPLSEGQHADLIEKNATEGRKVYVSKVAKPILDELTQRFPNWVPALVRQGDEQAYEPHYDLANPFVFERGGDMKFLLFYTNSNSAHKQQLSWILADSNTGKIADFGDGLEPETLNHNLSPNGSQPRAQLEVR